MMNQAAPRVAAVFLLAVSAVGAVPMGADNNNSGNKLNYGGLGFHAHDPFAHKFEATADADSAARRQLQAATPDKCSTDDSFQAWLALVNSACCQHAASACTNGLPSSCDQECANVLTPFASSCKSKLRDANIHLRDQQHKFTFLTS